MTGGLELVEVPAPPSTRSAARRTLLIALAAVLAIFGTFAGVYYFAMRPVILKIAVGPANSDDLKVVQALTQAFTQTRSYVRLRPVQTDGAVASAEALAQGNVDLAIIRGDLEVPKNAQAVATLRKNVAVLWVPPPAKGKKAGPKITKIAQLSGRRIGVLGRTEANVNLLKIILQQYRVDPNKVEIVQIPVADVDEAIRGQKADAYLAAGPVNSKITAEAIAASTRDGGVPTFLAIDSAEAIAQNHPVYEVGGDSRWHLRRLARPARRRGEDDQLFPPHRRPQRPFGGDYRRLHPAIIRDPAAVDVGIPAGGEDRNP